MTGRGRSEKAKLFRAICCLCVCEVKVAKLAAAADFRQGVKRMRYRRLGGTGLVVWYVWRGTMTSGKGEDRFKPVAGVDQAGADALVERSLAAGINFFDS